MGKAEGDLTEEAFSGYMYSAGIPDPDLHHPPRRGTEDIQLPAVAVRLLGILFYPDVLWPDFTPAELDKAIIAYQSRDRRFGNVKP
jgi:undecaprenyl diphosphate synthase